MGDAACDACGLAYITAASLASCNRPQSNPHASTPRAGIAEGEMCGVPPPLRVTQHRCMIHNAALAAHFLRQLRTAARRSHVLAAIPSCCGATAPPGVATARDVTPTLSLQSPRAPPAAVAPTLPGAVAHGQALHLRARRTAAPRVRLFVRLARPPPRRCRHRRSAAAPRRSTSAGASTPTPQRRALRVPPMRRRRSCVIALC